MVCARNAKARRRGPAALATHAQAWQLTGNRGRPLERLPERRSNDRHPWTRLGGLLMVAWLPTVNAKSTKHDVGMIYLGTHL